jgi:(p)ppGpp synthase/HD superfamily hydrolase
MSKLIQAADKFAEFYHGEIDQRRKYTNEPYIVHPRAVAKLVSAVGGTRHQIAAALLHDTVEDTRATIEDIRSEFGSVVASYVDQLTDPAKPEDGNRAARLEINLNHIKKMSAAAQTIKLADIINNTESIAKHDPKFAEIYFAEKRRVLSWLIDGNKTLYNKLYRILYGN